MYSSQELYRAQNCPYTLPSFNSSNSSHGCHYTCCADRLTPAPPLPPAPETRHPELKLLMFPSDLPLLRFSHLSERAPLASVLPGVGAPNGGILLSSSHRTFNPTLRPQFYSQIKSICPVGSPLTFSENPIRSPLNLCGAPHPL